MNAPSEPTTLNRLRASRWLAWTVAGLVIVGAAGLVLYANGQMWFYLDDWAFMSARMPVTAEHLLAAQNQNWHALTVLTFNALLAVFGFSYLPFRLLAATLVVVIGVLAYVYTQRRVGRWWALLPTSAVIVGPGAEILLWPFQMGQLYSLAAGLTVLALLDRPSRRWTAPAIVVLLFVGVCSSSAGVPILVLFAADRIARHGHRRQALLAVPAIVLYGLWYRAYGTVGVHPHPVNAGTLDAAAQRSIAVGQGALQSLASLQSTGARGALLSRFAPFVLGVVVCWQLFGRVRSDRPRIFGLSAALVAYWVLLSWGRWFAQVELSPRYSFLSQALLVLLLVELAVGVVQWLGEVREEHSHRARVAAIGVLVLVAVACVVVQVRQVRGELAFGRGLAAAGEVMRGQTDALALMPDRVAAGATWYLAPVSEHIAVPAPTYLNLLERLDVPRPTQAQLRSLPERARESADRTLWRTYIRASQPGVPVPFGRAPTVRVVAGSPHMQHSGSCVSLTDRAIVELGLAPGGAVAVTGRGAGPLTVAGRRYASIYGAARSPVAPGRTLLVRLPVDRGRALWHVRLSGTNARVCSLRR